MNEGWQLFSVRGIALRIHPSWFVILVVLTLGFQQTFGPTLGAALSGAALWAVSLAMALLLFVSVLLHELGHSLTAIAHGVKVRSITLFLLGGVARVDRECATARGAFLVAAAGPAVSLLLALLLLTSSHAARHASPVLGLMVEQLGAINLVLALFNLLPGLPFDGGLILKALVWQVTGSQRRGVEVANACGRFLSLLAVGLGVVLLLRGGGIAGLWLMLIGW
ncbi:MAG: site-2 protease family protein, partial [Cyanobacteriota bacterium]